MSSRPIYSSTYRVYWSETDAALMMHFSNFFRVCERVEEEFFWTLGLRFDPHSDIIFPRVHASCDYRSPLHPGDAYRVDLVEILVGKSSITYRYRFYNESRGGRLAAECTIVAVAYDRRTGRSIEVPGELRKLLLEKGAKPKS
ncbi:MAG: thioesterase family protein [Pyrodictiaceae archaeon]